MEWNEGDEKLLRQVYNDPDFDWDLIEGIFNRSKKTILQKARRIGLIKHNKTSRYKGVSFDPPNRWVARKTLNGKCYYIGSFNSEDAARAAYINFNGDVNNG